MRTHTHTNTQIHSYLREVAAMIDTFMIKAELTFLSHHHFLDEYA